MIQRYVLPKGKDGLYNGEYVLYTDHLSAIAGYEKELLRVDKFWNKIVDEKDKRIKELESRCCAVCNDTGHLEDAQAWDCGQPDSDCHYCPDKVDTMLQMMAEKDKEIARLRNSHEMKFVRHIEAHLSAYQVPICKICGKDIFEISEEDSDE